ncbi:MAG: hypothetical protein IPJ46_13165 [Anaerolineales bacterium]|nr:hypothetical protein [Anaerolineales bacterium]
MANEVDFDSLARQVMRADRTIADLDQLYGNVFALPQWHFIARGKFPNVRPYIASNVQVAEGQYMLRAFTDTDPDAALRAGKSARRGRECFNLESTYGYHC